MEAPRADAPRWFQFASADVVFLLLALVIVQAGGQRMLDDPGLGWHLRDVDAMREQGGWLTRDPFSGPRYGATYLTNQWLGDIVLYLGWKWAGLEGIAAVTTVVLALTLACLYRMLLRDGISWPIAATWTMVAALGTSCSWVARPNVFTLLFVLLTSRVCYQFHLGKLTFRQTLWLLPMFTLWANIHGGFLAGFLLLGLAFLVEIAIGIFGLELAQRQGGRERAGQFLLLIGGGLLATLINPYGIKIYPWIFSLLGDKYWMNLNTEWQPPAFAAQGAWMYEIVILLLPLMLGFTQRRPKLMELAFAVAGLYAGLTGFRYVPLMTLLIVPLLARSSVEVPYLETLARHLNLTADKAPLLAPTPGRLAWAWTFLVAVFFLGGMRLLEGSFARHNPKNLPAAELDELLKIAHANEGPDPLSSKADARRDALVLHDYNWGGYLTWHGWPAFRTWIDDRNEVQGREHVQEYLDLVQAKPGWRSKLANSGVQFIALPSETPLIQVLEEREEQALALKLDPAWTRIYPTRKNRADLLGDDAPPVVIFERHQPQQRPQPPPEPDTGVGG
jgi:hypothetical protein